MQKIKLLIFVFIIIGCSNSKKEKDISIIKKRTDSIMVENEKLQNRLEALENERRTPNKKEQQHETIGNYSSVPKQNYNIKKKSETKYAFIKLLVEETDRSTIDKYGEHEEKQKKIIVSDIEEINGEDDKAKFETAVIENYYNFRGEMYFTKGKILSSKIFSFGSYSEASEKRNTFLIGE